MNLTKVHDIHAKMSYESYCIIYLICISLKRQAVIIPLAPIISYIKGTKSYELSIGFLNFLKKTLISAHFTSSKSLNHIVICCISEIVLSIYVFRTEIFPISGEYFICDFS